MTQEFMTQFVLTGACGIILGLELFGLGCMIKWTVTGVRKLIRWIKKKTHPETTATD